MRCKPISLFLLCAVTLQFSAGAVDVSVYCTAGDVQTHMLTAENRERVLQKLEPLKVKRIFAEGRRGDEYVAPEKLAEVRDWFVARGVHVSGGIATVPGHSFGMR